MDSHPDSTVIARGFSRRQVRFEPLSVVESDHSSNISCKVEKALQLIAERHLRAASFEGIEFSEPLWAMLLDLYVSATKGLRVSVSSLCIASEVPASTALRCISQLERTGRLIRTADKNDRRRVFMSLAADTHREVDDYLGLICDRDRLNPR